MGLYRAQFISMIIMIALGVGIFVGFNMEWVSIKENTDSFFDATGYADYRIVSEKGFSAEDVEKVENVDGIEAASRYISVAVGVKEYEKTSLALTVTENEAVSGMYLVSGEKYDKASEDGIWLSDRFAAENGISEGDALTFVYKGLEIKGTVRGLIKSGEHMICVRGEKQLMPDFSTYGFAYISPEMYKKALGNAFYPQINVISDMDKKEFTEKIDGVFENLSMILTKDESTSYAGASGEAEEGQTMGSILPVVFLAIAVLTMVTTMHRIAAKEKTQIGTLKALGFKDRRILFHYTSYALIIGTIGSAIGVAIGYGIAWAIMNPNGMMGTYMDLPEWKLYFPWFCYVTVAGIILLLTLIGYLSVKKMLRGTAADALRPYSPKKMKPLAIEKTKWFHRRSFGTRWNMRDVIRHKSRTAMSLIGIIGCTVLIIGSLGMRDTMDSFIDIYYNGAINYATRIDISEDAAKEQAQAVIDRYKGDYSSSVGVQIGDEAFSLDIYNTKNGMIRFPDKNNDFMDLPSDGAFVCVRIADEFGLWEGDEITVSPYGTDKEYKIRVAGIVRSTSKNIAISPEYAEKLGVDYSVSYVYTNAESADIKADASIASKESKQDIMDSFDSFTEMMDMMIFILVAGALTLGVVVLYNLGVMSYTERYREMATLKVVGFKDKKIGRLLISQNLWLSVIGVALGIPCGIGLLDYLLRALAGEYEMKLALGFASIAITILLTIGMSLAVSFAIAKKNKKIDMVEALKGAE